MKKSNQKIDIEAIKRNDKIYLRELQIFFDKVDNIEDEELRSQILYQMHRCEERIILMCTELVSK